MTALEAGFVLDASVALAVLLGEPLVLAAEAMLATAHDPTIRLATPTVFDGECAGGLVRAVRRGRLTRDAAEEAWLDLVALPLERVASLPSVLAAMGTALDCGISLHDALYVALADELGLPLVTADARLVRALADCPHSIVYVGDVDL